jgi:ketosteroid isomerase-like protein
VDGQNNLAIVQRTYEAVGQGDIPGLLALMADDVEWTLQGPASIPFAGTRHGRDGVAEFFTLIGTHLDFEAFGPHTFVTEGNQVVALGSERSSVKATGRAIAQEWAHVYTIANGRITHFAAYEDTAALAAAFAAD